MVGWDLEEMVKLESVLGPACEITEQYRGWHARIVGLLDRVEVDCRGWCKTFLSDTRELEWRLELGQRACVALRALF